MSRKSRKNVGLIGLGIIGSRVAAGLRSGGFHVFVWNRSPRPAPNFLGSPIEVAELCEVIQLFVADGAAVMQTIEAMAEALTERHVIINCATIGPEATLEAARRVQARGAAFLDAPFTGSKGAAEKSQLVYYVGGDSVVYERVRPVLEATSRAIVHCGKIGDAATLKIATNMITAVTTQTLAEALAIVRKCGIAPEAFGAAIQQNACKSATLELKLPKMLTGDYSAHFSLKHMFKDVQLAVQMANTMQLEIPITASTAGVMFAGMNKGWSDLDFASVFKAYGEPERAEPKVKSLTEAPAVKELEDLEEFEVIEAHVIDETPLSVSPTTSSETGSKAEPAPASPAKPVAPAPAAKPIPPASPIAPPLAKDTAPAPSTPPPAKPVTATEPVKIDPTPAATSAPTVETVEAEILSEGKKTDTPLGEEDAEKPATDAPPAKEGTPAPGAISRIMRYFSSPN